MIDRRQFGALCSVGIGALVLPKSPALAQSFNFGSLKDYGAGSTVILPPGDYYDDVVIDLRGKRGQRVTLSVAIPFASVFHGEVTVRGQYGSVRGIKITGEGGLRVEGNYHRIEHCLIANGGENRQGRNGSRGITIGKSRGTVIYRCEVSNWNNAGVAVTGSAFRARIERCLFDNRDLGHATRAAAVQLGLGDKDAYRSLRAFVYLCRFVGWDTMPGGDKVLAIKSSSNRVRRCHFEDCDGRVQVRYGSSNVLEALYIENCRSLRVLDAGNQVLGCFVRSNDVPVASEQGIVVAAGNIPSGTGTVRYLDSSTGKYRDGHPNADQTLVARCNVDRLNVGSHYSGSTYPANATMIRETTTIENIHFVPGFHTNTDSKPNEPISMNIATAGRLGDRSVGPVESAI